MRGVMTGTYLETRNAYLKSTNQLNLATSLRRTPVKSTLSPQGIEKIQKHAVKLAHVLRQVTEKPHSNVGPVSKVFTCKASGCGGLPCLLEQDCEECEQGS